MRHLILLIALTAAGCGEKFWQDDVAVKAMTFPSNAFAAKTFADRLQWDIDRWRASLPAGCPMPFHYDADDPDARQVWLVPRENWQYPDKVGMYRWHTDWLDMTSTVIEIQAQDDGSLGELAYDENWNVQLHELGHALGLGHADPAYGPSLMSPDCGPLTPRDIEAAACALGCGPCGPDPYDRWDS